MAGEQQSHPLLAWPLAPSISAQVADRRILQLPWGSQLVKAGAAVSSSLFSRSSGPFLPTMPFDEQRLHERPLVYDTSPSSGLYRERTTTSLSHSHEHLGVGIGVSIGGAFLGASVSGRYDKSMLENHDACRTSQNASTRQGFLKLVGEPALSAAAKDVLAKSGLRGFEEAYGDYYVAGVGLGADAGVCVSFSQEDKQESEAYRITVTVKVLFFKVSHTWSHEESEAVQAISMTVTGFDTLTGKLVEVSSQGAGGLERLRADAAALAARNATVGADVARLRKELGLDAGKNVTSEQWEAVHRKSLVVELLLCPYSALTEVALYSPPTVQPLMVTR